MFESAKLKIERANQHIAELHALLKVHFVADQARVTCEFDDKRRMYDLWVSASGDLPPMVPIVVGDIAHNLRSALEHVASDIIALAHGEGSRKGSAFPMHETRENLVDMVDKGKIKAAFPEVAKAIVETIRPFKDGNKLLWATGQLWNIDKHRLPILSVSVTRVSGVSAVDANGGGFFDMTGVLDQGRVHVGGSCFPLTVTNYGKASFAVFFNEVGLLEGDPLIPTLAQMSQLVSQAVATIEEAMVNA